jgi:hypothetical protein
VAIVALLGYLISAEREARRPFLEKQLENCVRLAEAAGKLESSAGGNANLSEWESAWNRLTISEWKAAWYRVTIFSDEALDEVYNKFVKAGKKNMRENALCVVRMCRVMVHATWSVIPYLVREDFNKESICSKMRE